MMAPKACTSPYDEGRSVEELEDFFGGTCQDGSVTADDDWALH